MKKAMVTLGLALVLFAGARQAVASVPLSINYSGELVETTTGSDQVMTDKNGTFFVRLYSSPTGTTPLWARQFAVILSQGKFNIEISETGGSAIEGALATYTSLQDALRRQATDPTSDALYIGVRPMEDLPKMEILPRQRVVSVPFAALANDVVAARRNFTVTNGLVRVKNLTVLGGSVFSNKVTIAGTSEVTFVSSPLFVSGMTSSQIGKKVTISKSATVTGPVAFVSGLTVTSLTVTAASALNGGLTVNGASTFSGGLTAKSGLTVNAGGSNTVSGSITPSSGISVSAGGYVTVTNLYALNAGSTFPYRSILDSAVQEEDPAESTSGYWSVPKDCFVLVSVTFNGSGCKARLSTKFYASPTSDVGTGVQIAEVGMGTSSLASESGFTNFQGTTTASFFLKGGEYLTWSSELGTVTLKIIWRGLTYSY